ncbi:MAG: gliding motility-associated protein GldE [Bacteroidota bacterium]
MGTSSSFPVIPSGLLQVLPDIDTRSAITLGSVIGALFFLSFCISGSIVALFTLGEKERNLLKTKPHPAARRIVILLEEPQQVYATLLLSGLFVNVSILLLLPYFLGHFLRFQHLVQPYSWLLQGAIMALSIVFFALVLPKVWAAQNRLRFAYRFSILVEALHRVLRPFSRAAVRLADAIGKRAGSQRSVTIRREDLDAAIDIQSPAQATAEQKNILKGIIKFGNLAVRQVMRSRLDVSGVDYDSSFGDLLRRVEELHYSRLPVFRKTMDHVAGILYTKDLLPHLGEPATFDWRPLIRMPFFVPETKLLEDLLLEFQQRRTHFAVVVDEFGGTSGIVTMEDILEEVIGDIRDEFDEEESPNRMLDDGNYLLEGKTLLQDLCKLVGIPIGTFDTVRGDSETVAGLLLEKCGTFPPVNMTLRIGDLDFTVLEADDSRIRTVKVTCKKKENTT